MSEKKKQIIKKDWVSSFNLIGRPVINDYTFKINAQSQNSDWVYNQLNLGVDCGERCGTVYTEMMSGYSSTKANQIYAHGKKDDKTDDFDKQIIIDWEDRFNDDVLKEVGDLSFITVGLEKANDGKTFYKKFLSAYDAIAYVKEHLTSDMVVNIRGNLKYQPYQDSVQVRKNITSIALSKVDDASKYRATFTQSILLDKDSASLKNIDKDKSVMYVNARVLDYVKEVNNVEVKGQYPFNKVFEFELDLSNEKQCKTVLEKVFKVKKNVTQITFEGEFIESGAAVTATWEDVPDDIKDLVELGLYSKEDALAKCSTNGSRERRMVLKKPQIKMVGDDDKIPVIQKFEERYTEDDLVLDYLFVKKDDTPALDMPVSDEEESDNSMDWLNQLT